MEPAKQNGDNDQLSDAERDLLQLLATICIENIVQELAGRVAPPVEDKR